MPQHSVQTAYEVPLSGNENVKICIHEHDDIRADNLNLTTWTSSFVLARNLHKFNLRPEKDCKIPVLELGAGTGLVGITTAFLLQRLTILTDLPPIVPGLRKNVNLNLDTLGGLAPQVQCGTLDWNQPNQLVSETGARYSLPESKAGIILAADTIYDEAHPELLSRVILTWLDRTSTARAILCYPLRVCYLDQIREIWTLLEEGGLTCELEGQECAEVGTNGDDELLCEYAVWKWKTL
jgi:predicted nicotinamide N-methyase